MYNCPTCKEVITLNKRGHYCPAGMEHGQRVSRPTYYNPNTGKTNLQSSQPGYMKRFGNRSKKQ